MREKLISLMVSVALVITVGFKVVSYANSEDIGRVETNALNVRSGPGNTYPVIWTLKKGDTVKVITGKDKGKTGKVLKAMPAENKVVVQGVNVQTKHAKATRKAGAEIKHIEGPIDASNVMLYDTKAKKAVKVGYQMKDGQKVRVARKTGSVID